MMGAYSTEWILGRNIASVNENLEFVKDATSSISKNTIPSEMRKAARTAFNRQDGEEETTLDRILANTKADEIEAAVKRALMTSGQQGSAFVDRLAAEIAAKIRSSRAVRGAPSESGASPRDGGDR
jgi:hypothetical protein